MKIKNSTDWSDHFLRRMTVWCCRQLKCRSKILKEARFGKSRCEYGGLAYLGSRRIGVRVGDASRFPTSTYCHRLIGREVLSDREEALVYVTAHEIAHLDQYDNRSRTRAGRLGGGSEARTDRQAWDVLEKFRAARNELLAKWSIEPARTVKIKPLVADKRASKAEKDLARWQRKLKLAQTKVKKLRQRVKYYERTAATRAEKREQKQFEAGILAAENILGENDA